MKTHFDAQVAAPRNVPCPRCGYERPSSEPAAGAACRLCRYPLGGTDGTAGVEAAHRPSERPPIVLGTILGTPIHTAFAPSGATADAAGPAEAPAPSRRLRAFGSTPLAILACVSVLAATRLLMLLATTGAAPGDLAQERARRLEVVRHVDRHIARTAGDASAQALWVELKRRDLEAVRLLERALATTPRPTAPVARAFVDR